ncbi:MAG: hypothetical protein ACQKBY_10380, partial [Verrucomicrobiales bacterium]
LAKARSWRRESVLAWPEEALPGKKARKIHARCRFYRALGPLGRFLADERYGAHLRGARDLAEYAERVRGAALVTARFHALCFALAWRQPFLVAASNTGKIQALLADVGLEKRLVAAEALAELGEVPAWTPEEERDLADFLENVPTAQGEMVDAALDLLK